MKGSLIRGFVLATLVFVIGLMTGASQTTGELTLGEGTRLSLQLNDSLSTKLNSEGDTFTANIIVPIHLGNRLVIPKGSIVTGSISRIVRAGRFRGKALMNVLFHSIRLPGKAQVPLVASLATVEPQGNAGVKAEGTIEGEGSKSKDTTRVAGPGLTGAGIGGLAGGGKGAAIGAGAGAAIGLGTVFATRGKDVELRRGSTLDIVLDRPLTVPDQKLSRSPN